MISNTIETAATGVADPGELSATSVTVEVYKEFAANQCDEPIVREVLAEDATPAADGYNAITLKDTASNEDCLGADTANDADELDPQIAAQSLAEQLSHLVNSVAIVEEFVEKRPRSSGQRTGALPGGTGVSGAIRGKTGAGPVHPRSGAACAQGGVRPRRAGGGQTAGGRV